MGAMGLRVWWYLFFAMAIVSAVAAARNTISLSSGKPEVAVVAMEVAQVHQGGHGGGGGGGRRSLVVSLDYTDPSANHGHDPSNKGGHGRKSLDSSDSP